MCVCVCVCVCVCCLSCRMLSVLCACGFVPGPKRFGCVCPLSSRRWDPRRNRAGCVPLVYWVLVGILFLFLYVLCSFMSCARFLYVFSFCVFLGAQFSVVYATHMYSFFSFFYCGGVSRGVCIHPHAFVAVLHEASVETLDRGNTPHLQSYFVLCFSLPICDVCFYSVMSV